MVIYGIYSTKYGRAVDISWMPEVARYLKCTVYVDLLQGLPGVLDVFSSALWVEASKPNKSLVEQQKRKQFSANLSNCGCIPSPSFSPLERGPKIEK